MEVTSKQNKNKNDGSDYTLLEENEPNKEISINKGEPISVAKLYAKRENTIQTYKQRIGLLASTLLENPDLKVINIVLVMYDHLLIFFFHSDWKHSPSVRNYGKT